MIDLDFFYKGNGVGFFEETKPPQTDGKYRYMPYRGYGHLSMQTDRRKGIFPRCYYDIDGERISFTVIDCTEYGVLELIDFEKSKIIPKAK